MKRLASAIVLCAAAAIGLGHVHPFGDPHAGLGVELGAGPAKGPGTLLQDAAMSPEAKNILIAKCADCHSNETRWPVYARLAPGSWLIERDIVAARKKMNLSDWDRLSNDDQDVLIAKIIHEVKGHEMPPLQYRALHWSAKLTQMDVAFLAAMNEGDQQDAGLAGPGDAIHGRVVFQKRCTGCHALEADREGPRLAGVFGRKAGSVAGFSYSAGLKTSGLTWNELTLERWLSGPDLVAPDTKMDFYVPKAQERRDLIAFFKSNNKA